MKKTKTLLLSICLVCLLIPAGKTLVKAEEINASGKLGVTITYTFDEDTGVMILTGTGATYSQSYPYFNQADREKLKKLIIGDGITSIGERMFDQCENLTEIEFPETLTYIGFYTFGHCKSLTNLDLPDSLETLYSCAFVYCSGLKTVHIGKNLKSMSGSCIDTTQMESFSVDSANVYYSAIDGNLYNAGGTTLISYCAGKTASSFQIPEGVLEISGYAFSDCGEGNPLKKVVLPSSMKVLGGYAFRSAYSLEEIILPDGLTKIGAGAFMYCYGLKSITIPESVTSIEYAAFETSSIETLYIPAGLTKLADGALQRMGKLTAFYVDEGNPMYKTVDGVLFTKDGKQLLYYPLGSTATAYSIPNGVESLGDIVFENCKLKTVTFPDSLISIGKYCFAYSKLTSVYLPASVTDIASGAFQYSTYLSDMTIMNPYCNIYQAYYTLGSAGTIIHSPDKCSNEPSNAQIYADTFNHSFSSMGASEHTLLNPVSIGEGKHKTCCKYCDYGLEENCIYESAAGKEPTCTEDGYQNAQVCKTCGDIKSGDVLEALGHSLQTKEEIVLAASCSDLGIKKISVTCDRCDYQDEYSETISKTSHDYVIDPAKAATCTEDGITQGKHCKNCGFISQNQTKVFATGHDYVTNSKTTPASLLENGNIKKTDICTVCGHTHESTSTISKINQVSLSTTKYTYSGKAKKPSVVVKDAKGKKLALDKDYTISYATGRIKVGLYKVKVTFCGNYKGSSSLSFTIVPKSTAITKLTATSGGFKVYWTKQTAQTTGYEIRYSTSSTFKSTTTKKITKNTTVSSSISKLVKGKKYYVQIRTYKTVDSKKYYSSWSAYKTVTTKK